MSNFHVQTIRNADDSTEVNAYRDSDKGFIYGISTSAELVTEEKLQNDVISVYSTARKLVEGATGSGPQLLVE